MHESAKSRIPTNSFDSIVRDMPALRPTHIILSFNATPSENTPPFICEPASSHSLFIPAARLRDRILKFASVLADQKRQIPQPI